MTKNQLKNGDIVTLRNGDKMMYCNDEFTDLSDNYTNNLSDEYDIDDNLLMKDRDCKESDIMRVERPTSYGEIYDRKETVREMTVKEISKELGYEVKIVKE